jgi:hypothetical protein
MCFYADQWFMNWSHFKIKQEYSKMLKSVYCYCVDDSVCDVGGANSFSCWIFRGIITFKWYARIEQITARSTAVEINLFY